MALARSADLIGRREKEEKPLIGLERLFDSKNSAQVYLFDRAANGLYESGLSHLIYKYSPLFAKGELRSESQDLSLAGLDEIHEQYGEKGDSWRMKYVREKEAHKMGEIFFLPPKDVSKTTERQGFFGNLTASEHLDDLISLKNAAYNLLEGIGGLNASPSTHATDERSVMEMLYEGETEVKVYEDSWDHPKAYKSKEPLKPFLDDSIDSINKGLEALRELEAYNDPIFKTVFPDFAEFTAKVGKILKIILTPDLLDGKKKYPPMIGEIEDKNRNVYRSGPMEVLEDEIIQPYLLRMGASLEFAKKIKDEGWVKATFDKEKPSGYKKGWNVERPKEGQVKNDGTDDSSIAILSGANTSGKSFAMKTDFLLRIAGQSLGFVPAESANLRVFDNFIFIDRASTDSSNDLSAFMREVENWQAVLSVVNASCRLYVDEGYSTTSPKDQAKFLFATAECIKEKGGSTVLATHNDMVLERAERIPGIDIYHLLTEIGEDGELIRHFSLERGRSESYSVAVARTKKFPQEVLKWVEGYLKKAEFFLFSHSNFDYKDLEKFSEEEREKEKEKIGSLDHLFPAKPVNPLFHLLSVDPDFQVGRLFSHVVHKRKENISKFASVGRQKEFLDKMILWSGELSSKSVFERQKLIQELIEKNIWGSLHGLVDGAMALDVTFATLKDALEDGINQKLNPFRQTYPAHKYEPQFSVVSLDAAIAFLKIQKKISGGNFHFEALLDRFISLASTYKQVVNRVKSVEKNTELTEEESTMLLLAVDDKSKVPENATVGYLEDVVEELFGQVRDLGKDLPTIPLEKIDIGKIKKELQAMKDHSSVANALNDLPANLEKAKSLIAFLKTIDSIYLHQAANFLQKQIDENMALLNGEEVAEISEKDMKETEGTKFEHVGRRTFSMFGLMDEIGKDSPYVLALNQLDALSLFADIAVSEGFAKVEFNDTGKVEFRNAFSLFKKKTQEIRNSVSMDSNGRIQILTGPNGSGKTFYEKGAVVSVLMGLATGYAPAEFATMPIFDSVVYLDRVMEKQDDKLSAFSQELEYWKVLLSLLSSKGSVFTAVDEAFSSTSPTYQAAFTYGIIARFLQSNHFLMLSTHNHEVVDELQSQKAISASHFKFSVEDGRIEFNYKISEGHEQSHAVEVARKMGLPEEILQKT